MEEHKQIMPEVASKEISLDRLEELRQVDSTGWLIETLIRSQKLKKGYTVFLLEWNCLHKIASSLKKNSSPSKNPIAPSFEGVVNAFLKKHFEYAGWEMVHQNRDDTEYQHAALVYIPK
jgi:hypothetical protein